MYCELHQISYKIIEQGLGFRAYGLWFRVYHNYIWTYICFAKFSWD